MFRYTLYQHVLQYRNEIVWPSTERVLLFALNMYTLLFGYSSSSLSSSAAAAFWALRRSTGRGTGS